MKLIISAIVLLTIIQSLQITPFNLKISKKSLNDKDKVKSFFNQFIVSFHDNENVYRNYLSKEDFAVYANYINKLNDSLSKITDGNSQEIQAMIDDCLDELKKAMEQFNYNHTNENFTIVIKLLEQMFDKLFKILSVTSTYDIKVTLY